MRLASRVFSPSSAAMRLAGRQFVRRQHTASTTAPTRTAQRFALSPQGRLRQAQSGLALRALSTSAAGGPDLNSMLRAVCGIEEVQYYLQKFQKFEGRAFAVVKVGGDVVEYELDELTETCRTLWQAGLTPVVIHGGGPQMNDELKRQGVEPRYIRGSRVTDDATLAVAERIFTQLNERVVKAFQDAGMQAQGFPSGVFEAEVADPALMHVGNITGLRLDDVNAALDANTVPVLTSLGRAPNGQTLNINADVAARDLVIELQPMRVMFASAKGGWLDDDTGKIVKVVDMANEYEGLASLDYEGRQGTLLKLNEIKLILDSVPETTSVAIAAADKMLKELFSHKGAGSLFLKGTPVQRLPGDTPVPLLGQDMDKPPAAGADPDRLYVYGNSTEEARAALRVVRRSALGKDLPPIVSGMTLHPDAHGMGHEAVLWDLLRKDYESLAWAWRDEDAHADLFAGGAAVLADGTIADREEGITVAWFNRGHPLKGWTADKAPRLLVSYKEPDTHSKPAPRPRGAADRAAAVQAEAEARAAEADGRMLRVGLLGARGYVGREFVKLLAQHPNMELTVASSRALAGQRVIDCFGLGDDAADNGVADDLRFEAIEPEDLGSNEAAQGVDIWVLALPNGLAPKFVSALDGFVSPETVMIDLGADYRFDDTWTYGLPERQGARELLRGAKRISNPGCYATGTQVGLMPLLQPRNDAAALRALPGSVPAVFGVSGYSGAGTNPSDKNDPEVLKDNLLAYSLVNHMHERECSRHLGSRIAFMPHVAPFFQGIHLTLTAQLAEGFPEDEGAILEAYREYYEGQPLIHVQKEPPAVKDNMFQHHVAVGGFTLDKEAGRLALVSTIDNLLKGAATQAMQNLNIALDLGEYAAILDMSLAPSSHSRP